MIVSAFLTIATFPRLNFYLVGFIALIPLLKNLHKAKSSKKRFFVGFSYSIIILSVYHLWMFELTPWASFLSIFVLWLVNSAYNALFYGVGCIIYGYIRTEKNELWLFPCCWTLIEWIRSLGPIGNPAAGVGYSQSLNEWILPLASWFGVFGICWIVCFFNSLILKYIESSFNKKYLILFIVVCTAITIIFFQSKQTETIVTDKVKVAIVQPNHSQEKKLNSRNIISIQIEIIDLIKKAISKNAKVILLPETITPGINLRYPIFMNEIKSLAHLNDVTIIFGTPTKKHKNYYNSIAAVFPNKEISIYNKVKLMPFGEYWPLEPVFSRLGLDHFVDGAGGYTSGDYLEPLVVEGVKWGSLICLESFYPNLYKKLVNKGASILSIHVNNAWFFDSFAADQHLYLSRFRAVENNRYLVQVANTGISAIISNKGKIVDRLELNKKGIIIAELPFGFSNSVFSALGNIWIYMIIIYILITLIYKKHLVNK